MIGRTNTGGGGGGGLNFQVVGGTTAPSNPKENMIWVNTSTKITSYIFSATEPEAPADGKDGPVWITTGTSSTMAFNALKKNGIQVYPISAMQYVSGAWASVTVMSYQGGVWVDWWDGYFYKYGDEYTEKTGGFVVVGTASLTKETKYLSVTGSVQGGIYTSKTVDLTGISALVFDWTCNNGFRDTRFLVSKTQSTSYSGAGAVVLEATTGSGARKETTLDVSSLSGNYYIGVGRFATGDGAAFYIHSVRRK